MRIKTDGAGAKMFSREFKTFGEHERINFFTLKEVVVGIGNNGYEKLTVTVTDGDVKRIEVYDMACMDFRSMVSIIKLTVKKFQALKKIHHPHSSREESIRL